MIPLGAYVAWMLQDTAPPVAYLEGTKIIPDPVEDGGRVIVQLQVKKFRDCPGTVYRWLSNPVSGEVLARYDPVPSLAGRVSDASISKTFELPTGLPPKVRYEVEACYSCNALQVLNPICVRAPSVTFRVVPALPR